MAAPEPARAAPPHPRPRRPLRGWPRRQRWEVDEALGAWPDRIAVWGRAGDRPLPERARKGRASDWLPHLGVAPGRAPAGLGWVGGGGSEILSLAFGPGQRVSFCVGLEPEGEAAGRGEPLSFPAALSKRPRGRD